MADDRRKSIIKSGKSRDRDRATRKRLSFAPDAEGRKSTESSRRPSKDASSVLPSLANSACRMTTLGLYYDPKATRRGELRQHDTIPLKQSTRHEFVLLQSLPALSGNVAADVLITGEKIFAERLKMYLMEAHSKQHSGMDLHITCVEELPATVKAHFVLALFFNDTHESMRQLSSIVQQCSEGTLSSKRVMVVCVSSVEGCFKNVVDLEQFHTILNAHQLVHLTLKGQERLGHEEVNAMLELIQKSVDCHGGTSLLTDYTMQLALKNCFMRDLTLQGSALSITGK